VKESATRDVAAVNKESQRILEASSDANLAVLLDLAGKEWSSEELARQVQRWENDSIKEIAIVIGGPEGVGAVVADRADVKWRMSRLTLTHEMARVLVVEQFYRAYAINRGLSYQK
jgi:23S rRNA (pseudouridine1915-N3)-methyltransferase